MKQYQWEEGLHEISSLNIYKQQKENYDKIKDENKINDFVPIIFNLLSVVFTPTFQFGINIL